MGKLALNGGEPVVKRALGKRWPIFDEKEEKCAAGGLAKWRMESP